MMATHQNVNKLVIVKKVSDFEHLVSHILKADVESNNRGVLTLYSDGKLNITTWESKKVVTKSVEDVSDACWQQGGESEIIIACHNGMLVRYSLHFDTGLSCSLQLSGASLLALIREKDSNIRMLRSPKVLGYTATYILLQFQSDRLCLLATNGGGRPSVLGILRTPPLRTAHLYGNTVLVQPVTGCELYEYNASTCKLIEIVGLTLQRESLNFIEWGTLICSASGDFISLVDSERRLYVTKFCNRTLLHKRGGVNRSKVTLHQIVWPLSFQPLRISEISLALSDSLLSVFCHITEEEADTHHYLSFDVNSSSLTCHHLFNEATVIAPGLRHQLPDLFITHEGVAMLMDEDVSVSSTDSEIDLTEMFTALDESLKEQNIAKVTEVKAMIEQGLSVFLSSCNRQEGWVSLAEVRAQQFGKLSDLLLGYIPFYAQSGNSYSLALALKHLAKHHFMNIEEEMLNVLQYVDNDVISQMVLQMKEQVSFYLRSVELLQLPTEGADHKALTEQYLAWGDKPVKEILEDAISHQCVSSAESYLQLKPWVYGTVTTDFVVSTCIGIAREKASSGSSSNILVNIDEVYIEKLKKILDTSDDAFEVEVLGAALQERGASSHIEDMAVKLVLVIHKTHPDLVTLPPQIWTDLVKLGDASANPVVGPITVGQISRWTPLSMMLVMTDLYVCTSDSDILDEVDADVIWQYLLYQRDVKNLKRWIMNEFCESDFYFSYNEELLSTGELIWSDPTLRSPKQPGALGDQRKSDQSIGSKLAVDDKNSGMSFLMGPQYSSDMDSSPGSHDKVSVHSLSVGEVDSSNGHEFDVSTRIDVIWPVELFKPITQSMIDLIIIAGHPFSEMILNILANFGVFLSKEQKNAQQLMRRLLLSGAFERIGDMKISHSIQVSPNTIHKLMMEYFGREKKFMPAYSYIEKFGLSDERLCQIDELEVPSWTKIIPAFLKLDGDKSKPVIYDLSLKNLSLLCESCKDVDKLHLPALLTMLFAPSSSLEDFLNYEEDTTEIQNKEIVSLCNILSKVNLNPKQVLEAVAERYPYMQKIFSKDENTASGDVTVYDLLNESIPYDMGRLFTWQQHNRHGYDPSACMPTFSDKDLIKNYGLYHTLDFMYYLRAARPSYACAALVTSIGINEKRMEDAKNSIYGLALNCWPDRGVCSACVALLYMCNLDAEPLRVILASAYMVLQAKIERCSKMKAEKRQAQEHIATTEVKNVLEQLCRSESRINAASVLLEMLEESVMISANSIISSVNENLGHSSDFEEGGQRDSEYNTEAPIHQIISKEHSLAYVEGMRVCVDLSRIYELPYPTKLLISLAESNQWLLFIILVQVFKCPRVDAVKVAETFQNIALREHMMFALAHIHYYRSGDLQREGSRPSSRNLRSSLYSRIGIQIQSDSISPAHSSGDEKPRSNSPTEFEPSTIDDALSLTSTETCFDVGLDAWFTCGLTDLYSILLTCHNRDNPAGELATACVALQAPVLSVLAACYCKENSLIYLSIWLYTQLEQEDKKKLHSQIIKSEVLQTLINDNVKRDAISQKTGCCRACDTHVLQSGLNELKHFMLSHVSGGSLDAPIEGLKIFFQNSPLLPLLKALHEAKTKCRQDVISNLLSECATAMSKDSQGLMDDTCQNTEWLTSTVVDIIGTALDCYITNGHVQCLLLNLIKCVGQQPPFSCHGINWGLVSELCNTLGGLKWNVKYLDLLWSFENGILKSVTDKILAGLTSGKKFAEALQISHFINLPVHDIKCAEIKAEFERDHLIIKENCSNLLEFLKKIHTEFCKEMIPQHQVVNCFVSISQQIERHDMQYLCLQYAVIWTYKKPDGSSPSSATITVRLSTKVFEAFGGEAEDLELKMWNSYLNSQMFSETEVYQLSITPLGHLGPWPWEGSDGVSQLNRSLILQSSGMNIRTSENTEMENENRGSPSASVDLSKSPVINDESNAFHKNNAPSNLSSPESIDKEGEKDILQELQGASVTEIHSVHISALVDLCVDKGLIITACRILRFFKKSHEDITTLLQMLGMADGSEQEGVSTSDPFRVMPPQHTTRKRQTRSMSSRNISVCSSLSVLSLDPEDDVGLKTPLLLKKSSGLRHGRKTAERIIMLYRIASSLDLSYLYVIHHPTPITLLSLVLKLKGGSVIQLARDLIHALPIPKSSIVSFLCEEAVATITAGPGAPATVQTDRLLRWDELETRWRDLIALCEDPSAVGSQLLDVGSRLGSSYPDQLPKVHSMSVELVIRAHDCFTAAANMEGISTILKTSFYLTSSLMEHSQWSLMVRLLTGVGRYGEMSYIIDALREHDQFEPLLGRGSEQKGCKSGLDRALVHYLRSKYPDDTDTLILVALHFFLYSEVASMWAADAEKLVGKILEATVDVGESCSLTVTR
ncbi:hypothetical protein SK128_028400 [Halocaridina rubra]|uniref:Spatacsin C-terminal domain-containing protein n=1 Tax=Halocaridina rubra TaxID=373956 RepID=A0AAN9AAY2_HALRR